MTDLFYNQEDLEKYSEMGYSIKEKECKECGESFEVPECASRTRQNFCSLDCEESHQIQATLICKECGKKFKGSSEDHYCSDNCRQRSEALKLFNIDNYNWDKELIWNKERLKDKKVEGHNIVEFTCEVCEKKYLAPASSKNLKVCSQTCYYTNNKVEKECELCGKKYMGNKRAKYCSNKCRELAQSNPDYYAVFYRDHFRCRYCGKAPADEVRLTIDHVYPKSKGGKEHKFNLVTACQECNSHKGATLWSPKRIKEIWWQNKKLAQDVSNKDYEEIVEEFKEEYPDITMPDLRGGH